MSLPQSTLQLSFLEPTHLTIKQQCGQKERVTPMNLYHQTTKNSSAIALELLLPEGNQRTTLTFEVDPDSNWITSYVFQLQPPHKEAESITISFADGQPFVLKGQQWCKLVDRRDDFGKENLAIPLIP